MDAYNALRVDINQHGLTLSDQEWRDVCDRSVAKTKASRNIILDSAQIGTSWVFVASGFAASFYAHQDGRLSLTRFFEPGQMAGNVTSTWLKDYGSDELKAITDLVYIELPHAFLLQEYMQGAAFGAYVRMKVVETLQYDKDLLVSQTINDPDLRFQFLNDHHPGLIDIALKKDIAAFLGVTPQGYSRLLRRKGAG